MDGFLRLTHGFCLARSNSEQAEPPGTSVYIASQARLGGPIFTPRCFPKKTYSKDPLPKVKKNSEKQLAPGYFCCIVCFSCTLVGITCKKHKPCVILKQKMFYCSHKYCEYMATILFILSWHYPHYPSKFTKNCKPQQLCRTSSRRCTEKAEWPSTTRGWRGLEGTEFRREKRNKGWMFIERGNLNRTTVGFMTKSMTKHAMCLREIFKLTLQLNNHTLCPAWQSGAGF